MPFLKHNSILLKDNKFTKHLCHLKKSSSVSHSYKNISRNLASWSVQPLFRCLKHNKMLCFFYTFKKCFYIL